MADYGLCAVKETRGSFPSGAVFRTTCQSAPLDNGSEQQVHGLAWAFAEFVGIASTKIIFKHCRLLIFAQFYCFEASITFAALPI